MTRYFVYVIVDKKTRKLYKEEAYDTRLLADQHRFLVKHKTEVLELRLFK